MTLTVHFDVPHLYYLPQYLPVAQQLEKAGHKAVFVMYTEKDLQSVKQNIVTEESLNAVWVESAEAAFDYYCQASSDWIIFGNSPSFKKEKIHRIKTKFALMLHGIGPKACYYESSQFKFDVRFVEGETRQQRLQQLFPTDHFEEVGFAKLDPLFNTELQNQMSRLTLQCLSLDEEKPTLLYAPTFFPSSIECFSSDWPEQLNEYNLIVKPHFFSLIKSKYKAQRKLLNAWSNYPNVHVTKIKHYSLLPFMQLADVMMSEASSAMFEFITLDKPVVWFDFYHKRWSYRGLLSFRFRQRLDDDMALFNKISLKAQTPTEANHLIKRALADKSELSAQRAEVVRLMAGKTDGMCSQRIVRFLEQNTH